jgi:hypothetical protein
MKTKRKQFEQSTEISPADLLEIHGGMEGTVWEVLTRIARAYLSNESGSLFI